MNEIIFFLILDLLTIFSVLNRILIRFVGSRTHCLIKFKMELLKLILLRFIFYFFLNLKIKKSEFLHCLWCWFASNS